MMLAVITYTINLFAMSISLWMAFYLFSRGYPNQITARAVLALLAIAVFFLGTYNQFFDSFTENSNLLAALLVIALVCWYSVTFAILSTEKQKDLRWMEITIYILGSISIFLLVTTQNGIVRAGEDKLYTAHLETNIANILYGVTQLTASAGVLFNLSIQHRVRSANEGRYFLIASLFLILALGYGILSLSVDVRMPRVIEDGLVFAGIFLLGISVARYQSLVERRTIWQDFTVATLAMFGIVVLYLLIFLWAKLPTHLIGNFIAVVIISHSMYDVGREVVERWRMREETYFRRKINQPKILDNETLHFHLSEKLVLFLKTVNASSGLIATNQNGKLLVVATKDSLPLRSEIQVPIREDANQIQIPEVPWNSISFEGMQPIALVGMGPSNTRIEYSAGELELLEEFSEQIGTLISISNLRKNSFQPAMDQNFAFPSPTEIHWIKSVENGLRHFSDYLALGQSPLAEWSGLTEISHIERGKKMQNILREAIHSMKPEGERPPEPLPREWYNYVVLNDAYVKGLPNREVMARLYVSEGTFHRIRRHAIRGVARYLAERIKH